MVTSCTTKSWTHFLNPLCSAHSLQARIAKIALLVLGVAIGCAIYRLITQRSVSIGTPKPKVAEVLESEAQVKTLTEQSKINGIPMEEIQKRAKRRYEESLVFLGPNDSLLVNLQESWKDATKLGVTHIEIADVLEIFYQRYRDKRDGFTDSFTLDLRKYLPQIFKENSQQFNIMITRPTLEKKLVDADVFSASSTMDFVEIMITNPLNPCTLYLTPMRIAFIRKYGFYALGTDFWTVMSVLTGKKRFNLKARLQTVFKFFLSKKYFITS